MREMLNPVPNAVKLKTGDLKRRSIELVRCVHLDASPGIRRIVALVCLEFSSQYFDHQERIPRVARRGRTSHSGDRKLSGGVGPGRIASRELVRIAAPF
jgi:hypothetical protein